VEAKKEMIKKARKKVEQQEDEGFSACTRILRSNAYAATGDVNVKRKGGITQVHDASQMYVYIYLYMYIYVCAYIYVYIIYIIILL
jgi:hypothetical protein